MNGLAVAGIAVLIAVPPVGVTVTGALISTTATTTTANANGAPCGPGGPAQDITGGPLDPEQLANAATIITATHQRHLPALPAVPALPARAAVTAVATALQESGLRNLPYGDRDSLGLFQQRASWGPASVRLDPVASTGLFLDALEQVPDWQALATTVASDRVQHSAFPWAVAKWEATATALVATYWPPDPTGSPGIAASAAAAAGAAAIATDCPGQGSDGMGLTGATTTPAGYLPSAAGVQGAVTRFALAQLGKPYLWGATGPDAWDCSSLTMTAWAAAGITLPRTTFQQVLTGSPVTSTAGLQPGDLIFTAGLDGTPSSPGHVGLFLGDVAGVPSLIHAPRTGRTVEIQALSAWRGQIVAIRRPTTTTTATTNPTAT